APPGAGPSGVPWSRPCDSNGCGAMLARPAPDGPCGAGAGAITADGWAALVRTLTAMGLAGTSPLPPSSGETRLVMRTSAGPALAGMARVTLPVPASPVLGTLRVTLTVSAVSVV